MTGYSAKRPGKKFGDNVDAAVRAIAMPFDIREIALPPGYADAKVCTVDAIWSGLKLVVRRELRETQSKAKQEMHNG